MTQPRTRTRSASPFEARIGFCRAVRDGDIIAVSGTAPIGPDGRTAGVGDPAEQTRRCFRIVQEALESLGASLEDVIRTRVYITRLEDWEAIGSAHGEIFGDIPPASTILQVQGLLDPEWRVEVEADAVVRRGGAGGN
ncbi:MAG: RidA family protein [Gemmatimonadota bacterium]